MGINKIRKVVFRTFGGENIGYGHYYRCYSLARAILYHCDETKIEFIVNEGLRGSISNSGFKFFINDNIDLDIQILGKITPDIIIFDSYLASDLYLSELTLISKLIIFDDNNDIYDTLIPDVVLNGNIYAKQLNYKTRENAIYLLGPEYLVMKEAYWNLPNKSSNNYTSKSVCARDESLNVLITTGGSDTFDVSVGLLNALSKTKCIKKVIIGPSYSEDLIVRLQRISEKNSNIELIFKPNSLKEHIANADIVLTAGGSTVYEVITLEKLLIVFSIINNQDRLCSILEDNGAPYIGKYPNINYSKAVFEIENLIEMKKNNKNYNHRFCIKIDGKGALRIAEKILHIL